MLAPRRPQYRLALPAARTRPIAAGLPGVLGRTLRRTSCIEVTDRLGANLDGMLAEYAVFSEEALVNVPSRLSFEEAATLPCAAVTAWVALTGHRSVTAGDTVLTHGSGGVSVRQLAPLGIAYLGLR